jgi:PTS system nitrogen regulatory IIA component
VKVLTVREVADILKLHPRTVTKMVRGGEIPATRIGRVWRFEESVVLQWFNHQLRGTGMGSDSASSPVHLWNGTTRVAELLYEDTVQYTAERRSKREVLEALAALAVRTHLVSDYQQLLQSLCEREDMCPTALEGGVAFPHPRHPLGHLHRPVLAMLVTRHGVDFGAPDEEATRIFILVCSTDDRSHVKILSHLARLFRPGGAVAHLTRCHTPGEILREVHRLENQMIAKIHPQGEEIGR